MNVWNDVILSIDPSIAHTAWSAIDRKSRIVHGWGSWKTKPVDSWMTRMEQATLALWQWEEDFLNPLDLAKTNWHIIIEIPDSWTRGKNNTGALMKLCFAIGWYSVSVRQILLNHGIVRNVEDVTVSAWKGRRSKQDTWKPLEEVFSTVPRMNEHHRDAIAIGLWHHAQIWGNDESK